MSGFMNIGNTCYMNSILQSLIHTQNLTNFIISGKYNEDINHNKIETKLLNQYVNILREYSNLKVIIPSNFKNIISIFKQ